MAKEIVNKSVSFNVLDPFQRQLKSHCDKYPNFSGYIKRLIQRDMEQEQPRKKAPLHPVNNRIQVAPSSGSIKYVVAP
jgi:hypothetical protein